MADLSGSRYHRIDNKNAKPGDRDGGRESLYLT